MIFDLDPLKYIGELEPEPMTGRWIWPFKIMEIGDHFHVSKAHRPTGSVRKYAALIASTRDDCTFSVTDQERQGYTTVLCVPKGETLNKARKAKELIFCDANAYLREAYDIELSEAVITAMTDYEIGQGNKVAAIAKTDKLPPSIIFTFLGKTFGLAFLPTDYVIKRLEPGTTSEQWANEVTA